MKPLRANPNYRKLKAWCVAHCPMAARVAGKYYRVAGPRYTSAGAIVSGIGGFIANGRWCRRGTTKLLYLSEGPETALAESNEHARRNALPLWDQMPKVVIAVDVIANVVLDLTDAAITTRIPFSLLTLMSDDWRAANSRGEESLTQALGRAALAAGFEGLRVPSKPDPNGTNLIVFVRSKGIGGAKVTLLHPDSLEKLGRS